MKEKTNVDKKTIQGKSKKSAKIKVRISNKNVIIISSSILIIVIVAYLFVAFLYPKLKYDEYTKIIEKYEFNNLYNNSKANSYDTATFGELIKVSCGVVMNKQDEQYALNVSKELTDKEMTATEAWRYLANFWGVNIDNSIVLDGKANKTQAAIIIVKEIEKILKTKIEITSQISDKYIELFNESNLEYINKALSIGIIQDSSSDLKSNSLLKGELNKMLVLVMNRFGTLYYKAQNGKSSGEQVVWEMDKLPKNLDIYPYVLDNVDKSIYEITTDEMNEQIGENPLDVYMKFKDGFNSTEENVSEYFEDILNVDYRTIDLEKFIVALNFNMVYDLNLAIGDGYYYRDTIKQYVDYVQKNKIIIKGKAIPLLPIIYSNGLLHFLRVKVEFEVINSDTNENLLLWDKNVKYNGNHIELYVDLPVSRTYGAKDFKVFNDQSLANHMIKSDGNVEVIK